MTSRFTELVVDCHDPERLAAFWCEVLDFTVLDRSKGMGEIGSWVPTAEDILARQMPPTLLFIQVSEGKTVKNRLQAPRATSSASYAAWHRRTRPRRDT